MRETLFGPNGWTPETLASQSGKTFVITGANAGAGFEATRILLSRGAQIVMLNRNAEKSAAAIATLKQEFGPSAKVAFIHMDLAAFDSVRAAARELKKTVSRIDALICNAAIAQVPSQRFTKDGFESQLGTNHYGHFLLCGIVFDTIERSNGRIVVVASLGYKMGIKTIQFEDINWNSNYHPNRTYCHSKLAQMMFAYELQDKIAEAGKNVSVYVCHPGAAATSLISTSGGVLTRFMWSVMAHSPFVQSAERGAFPEVMCATENGLAQRALYGPTKRMETVGPVGQGTLEAYALEKPVLIKLWERSEIDTGFRWVF